MRARLQPAQAPPLWQRILGSALAMSLFGALLGIVLSSVAVAILSGALLGLIGLRPVKVALGVAVGAALGFALQDAGPAWVAAIVTVVYRAIAAFAYRNRPLVRVMAQEVPAAELRSTASSTRCTCSPSAKDGCGADPSSIAVMKSRTWCEKPRFSTSVFPSMAAR